jgi:hypothetical protein
VKEIPTHFKTLATRVGVDPRQLWHNKSGRIEMAVRLPHGGVIVWEFNPNSKADEMPDLEAMILRAKNG